MAAALRGKIVKEMIFQLQQQKKIKGQGNCFGCRQPGHLIKNCPKKQGQPQRKEDPKQPGLCPKCKRGKHWASECKSKRDASGNPLIPGNEKGGQPPAPQQCYGALQQFVPQQQNNPFRNSSEQPQAVQDWTSVAPPIQY